MDGHETKAGIDGQMSRPMKLATCARLFLMPALLLAAIVALPVAAMAAQPTVNLGTTSSFAVLAGSTITNTGPSTVNGTAGGDIGLYPGTSFTGQVQVTLSGASHINDSVANIAKNDLTTAYNDAAGRTPVTTIPTELGGETLTPGVYDSAAGTFQITGTLTLDAQGDPDAVFIFKTASTLITASDSRVSIINNGRPCRVFWQVGSSATLGTNSHFVGHIFALTSITANNGATVQGQLLARNGAVTLNTNIITNALCSASTTPAIYVSKTALPRALVGTGSVTYTYVVTNAGNSALGTVTVTDDKLGPVNYVSGDINSDGLLQPGETWIYTATTVLSATTTNTALASGETSVTSASATSAVTVVVASPAPAISVVKTASPKSLTKGPGWVTFTYRVGNPGNVDLSQVNLSDNKISGLKLVSGDTNHDGLLQPGETWVYSKRVWMKTTTTNVAVAQGTWNGIVYTSSAALRLLVTGGPIGSGAIPRTATLWYNLLLLGVLMALVGTLGYWRLGGGVRTSSSNRVALGKGTCALLLAVSIGLIGWSTFSIAQPIDSLAGYPGSGSVSRSESAASAPSLKVALAVLAHPKVGDKLGVLSIPKLGQRFPIVEGTTPAELRRGVGHFRGSVMPGGGDNCVLSGHRDTVFTKLAGLKKGDRLIVSTAAGAFTYRITGIRIVNAKDKTVVVHTPSAMLTLTTCYPFRFVGSAPKRYVISAALVSGK